MTFYYTPKLRPYDAGILMIGQTYLYIPPGETAVTATGTCPGKCTRDLMVGNINITTAVNHMHYLGTQQRIELLRNGSKVQDITLDEAYRYDNPVTFNYDNPIEVRPGDELKTTCVFRSTSRYKTTTYGEDTSKEMCFGFITYYPKNNIIYHDCSQWNNISICDWEKDEIQGCRYKDIANLNIPQTAYIYNTVMENCVPLGICKKECLLVVRKIKTQPCFKGDMDQLLRFRSLSSNNPNSKSSTLEFYAALDSCNVELALEAASVNDMQENCTILLHNNFTTSKIYKSVMDNCATLGKCHQECFEVFKETKKHPCFQGDIDNRLRARFVGTENHVTKSTLLGFYTALAPCNVELAFEAAGLIDLQKNSMILQDEKNGFSEAEPVWQIQPLLVFVSLLLGDYSK
ncbi:hypothetical protein CHS0354_020684 [Potamilus streckersoni]|uniref:Copper type II ascorbate-dependent monooxygenase C-terminal domain-containing protein n=1 Tax=Potamilus streckersoni TaxID=2493646 RepID=A0AAE0SE39_9BIVA|nr:hypothetical protein CHS0354_020684 [Potamilus streckersoni]